MSAQEFICQIDRSEGVTGNHPLESPNAKTRTTYWGPGRLDPIGCCWCKWRWND